MIIRRLLIIVAVLMAVTTLTAALSSPPQRQASLPDAPPRTPAAGIVERTLDASAQQERTVDVEEGDTLRLTVRGSALDGVQIEGLDQLRAIAPETPAVFDVLVDKPGTYPVTLLESGRQVGAVRVTPAAG